MAGPGQARFYSSTFVQTSLASGISAGATSFNVGVTTGAPGTPFIISVDQNSASEELMLVTNVSGLTYTVTRGVGGTSAVSHSTGASVVHVMYAQDLTDASAHIGAFDNVHGLSVGSLVVGTTDTQTLTNKTLTNPTITTPTITTPTITGTTTAGAINSGALTSTGLVKGVDFQATGLTGAVQASRWVGGSNQAPTTGTFAVGDMSIDGTNGIVWVCIVAGTPGTWEPMINKDSVQTMNNKTVNAGVFTGAGTGSGSLSLTSFLSGTLLAATGNTGAANSTRIMGATTGGPPTSGTFSLNDVVVDQTGNLWICTSAGTPGTWAEVSQFKGAGYATNIISGGANITATQAAFSYANSKVVTTTAGGAWSQTFNDATFHGCGSLNVTPGNNAGSLGFVNINISSCSISAGNITIAGNAYSTAAAALGSGVNIQLNFHLSAW